MFNNLFEMRKELGRGSPQKERCAKLLTDYAFLSLSFGFMKLMWNSGAKGYDNLDALMEMTTKRMGKIRDEITTQMILNTKGSADFEQIQQQLHQLLENAAELARGDMQNEQSRRREAG